MTNYTLTFKSGKPEIINEAEGNDLANLFLGATGIPSALKLSGNILGDVLDYTNLLSGLVLSFLPFTQKFKDVIKEYRDKKQSSNNEFNKLFEKSSFSKFILLTGMPSFIGEGSGLGMILPAYIFNQAFINNEENNIKKIFSIGYKYFVFTFAKYAIEKTLPYLLVVMAPFFDIFRTVISKALGIEIDKDTLQKAFGDYINQKNPNILYNLSQAFSVDTKHFLAGEGTSLQNIKKYITNTFLFRGVK